jgi:hypothetical protein
VSTPELFIDGIGNLAVQGAVARIELTVIEKLPLQDETPQLAVAERLVMRRNSFEINKLRSIKSMLRSIK